MAKLPASLRAGSRHIGAPLSARQDMTPRSGQRPIGCVRPSHASSRPPLASLLRHVGGCLSDAAR
eukprot:5963687-Lingulodinium_polyedra.AAC.1